LQGIFLTVYYGPAIEAVRRGSWIMEGKKSGGLSGHIGESLLDIEIF
jgi:hypothetical protein